MSCLYHIGSHCTAPRAHMHPNKTGSAGCVPPPSPPARSPPPQVVRPPLTENTVGKCPLTHWTINSNFTATLQMLITKHTILKSYPSKRTEKSRRLTHCQCQLWNPLWLGKCESVKVKAANCAKVLKTFSHTAHVAQFIPPERTAIVLLLMKFVLLPIVARGRSAFLSEVTLAKITSWSHSHPFRLISKKMFLFCLQRYDLSIFAIDRLITVSFARQPRTFLWDPFVGQRAEGNKEEEWMPLSRCWEDKSTAANQFKTDKKFLIANDETLLSRCWPDANTDCTKKWRRELTYRKGKSFFLNDGKGGILNSNC